MTATRVSFAVGITSAILRTWLDILLDTRTWTAKGTKAASASAPCRPETWSVRVFKESVCDATKQVLVRMQVHLLFLFDCDSLIFKWNFPCSLEPLENLFIYLFIYLSFIIKWQRFWIIFWDIVIIFFIFGKFDFVIEIRQFSNDHSLISIWSMKWHNALFA